MKVLLADDDRILTHLMASRLRAKGWHVTVASDAMQALMYAMKTMPDVIVLDIHMPGGTGFNALTKLRQSMKTSQIPIVVLSGSIEPKDEPGVLEAGADAFLRKPTDPDDLHAVLQGLVDSSRPKG